MNHFSRGKSVSSLFLALCASLLLAACGANVKGVQLANAKAVGAFDLTLQAYKSGQFLLNGAVLSSMDLSSHFAYLRDQHKLPKTVLLEDGEDASIRSEHLTYMASMAYTYGFTVYFTDDGELSRIIPDQRNKTELRGSPKSDSGGHPHIDNKDAAHDGRQGGIGY